VQLVLDRGAGEEGPARGHLVENAAHAPPVAKGLGEGCEVCGSLHVDRCGVLGGAKQHVWRPVPQCHHLVTVRLGGD
jgi:hypothetical protein